MPEKEIIEAISHADIIKYIISGIIGIIGINITFGALIVKIVNTAITVYKKDTDKKIRDVFEKIGEDISRLAGKLMTTDDCGQEAEKNIIRMQGEIDGVIAVCKERHGK